MSILKTFKNWLQSPESPAPSRGDTIIEVLISMTILSLALVITFVSTSRSLGQGDDATNRQAATSYAQQQVELIKANPSLYEAASDGFCILPGSTTPVTDLSKCSFGGQYSVTDKFSSNLFTVGANWQGATSQDNLALYYKIPGATAYVPPPCPAGQTRAANGNCVVVPVVPVPVNLTVVYTVMGNPNIPANLPPTFEIRADGNTVFGPHGYSNAELSGPGNLSICSTGHYPSPPPLAYDAPFEPNELCAQYTQIISVSPAPSVLSFIFSNDDYIYDSAKPGCTPANDYCYDDNNIVISSITIPGYRVSFSTYGEAGNDPPEPPKGVTVGPPDGYTLWENWDGTATFNVSKS